MSAFLQAAAESMSAPVSFQNILLALNTLTSLAIVWGGGRLLGKIETELERTVKLVDLIEARVGRLEGRQ